MKASRLLFAGRLFLLGVVLVAGGGCGGGSSSSGGSSGGNTDGVTAPVILAEPQSRTVVVGQTAAFSVVATGSAPLAYQWRRNATDIPGATASSYTTAAVTSADNGAQFTVVVSNSAGTATSSAATLTVNEEQPGATAPVITTQPLSRTVVTGQTATFSVVATGTAPLAYQWRKGETDIPDATSSSYTTAAVTPADNGAQFTVVVSNSAGTATSSAATLTVHDVQPVKNGSRYPSGRILSPITPTVATRLNTVFALGKTKGLKDNVFFKVGDSISAGPNDYLYQFTHPAFDSVTMHGWDDAHDLGGYQSLKGAHDYFKTGRIVDDDPYTRTSVAARVGQVASWALGIQEGQTDHPLQTELQTTQGAYSVIMFGTNNFYPWNPASDATDAATYREIVENTFKMLDYCIVNGSVPILTAPPPFPGEPTAMKRSRMTSRLLRAAAQGRQIPFIDYYASMLDLPNYGLQQDGIHPNAMDYHRYAFLTEAGLKYGYNMRNLVTLQSLDRMYRLLVVKETAPDAETGGLQGAGLDTDPFVIDETDFSDYQVPASGATAVFYKLTVADSEAWQFVAAGVAGDAISIEIRDDQGTLVGASTVGVLAQTLAAGTYNIKAGFPASVREFVFAALEGSRR